MLKNLFCSEPFNFFLQEQVHGRQVGDRLGNGVLSVPAETGAPELFHDRIHAFPEYGVKLADQLVGLALGENSDFECAPRRPSPPQRRYLNFVRDAPRPLRRRKLTELFDQFQQIDECRYRRSSQSRSGRRGGFR